MTNLDNNALPLSPAEEAARRRRQWMFAGPIIGASLLLILVVSLIPRPDPAPYDPDNSSEAVAQCKDLVIDNLKAPSTATFGQTKATGGGTWTVTGYVDAENGFGAMLRSEFQCTVVVDNGEIRRRLDYLE